MQKSVYPSHDLVLRRLGMQISVYPSHDLVLRRLGMQISIYLSHDLVFKVLRYDVSCCRWLHWFAEYNGAFMVQTLSSLPKHLKASYGS